MTPEPPILVNADPILELLGATVVKNGVRVLDDMTLTIRRGQHTAIMGPNGAGKSALINLLTHQDRPLARGDEAPSVRVFGRSRWNVFELRPQLGIVSADLHHRFVNGNSRGRIRVEDAVLSGFFGMHGLTPDDAVTSDMRTQARLSLERMEASHLAGRFVDEMSTGEARRVLVARALVTMPQALLLDEPATGLDLVARRRLAELMDRVAAAGTTLILVTHQVEEIVPSISHIVYLKGGRVMASGPRDALLTSAHLSNLFGSAIELSGGDYLSASIADNPPNA
jgi:iron complex transport system ATP-binding protein